MSDYERRFHAPVVEEAPRRRRRLPRPVRWLVRCASLALVITLVGVFYPALSGWLRGWLFDGAVNATLLSSTMTHQLTAVSRLESTTVHEEGQVTATVEAALFGEVQRVTIQYDYDAVIGIDLKKVSVSSEENRVTFRLPEVEILSDSLTPTFVDRQDFWYPLTEKRRMALLEGETERRRAACLEEAAASSKVWENTCEALRQLVGQLEEVDSRGVVLQFERQETEKE